MPKTKLQNIIFTLIMAFVMVYAMVCYNIALDKGGMTNEIFLLAFYEIPISLYSGILCRRKAVPEAGIPHGISGG